MKRFLVIPLFIFFINSAFSITNNYSKWSFTGEYGFTYFYGDLAPLPPNLFPKSATDLVFGFSAEYAFSPVWGLSADYYHLPISGMNKIAYFKTDLNNGDLNITVNFTKWIFPQTISRFSVNGSLGIGGAFFTADYRYPDPVHSAIQQTSRNIFASAFPVSFSGEYHYSPHLTFGLRMHYRAFNSDNLEGVPYLNFKGVTNDYIALVSFTTRYKLLSNKKVHLRNINALDFIGKSIDTVVSADSCGSCIALELARKNSCTIDSLKSNSKQLKIQLDAVMSLLANYSVDTDKDGVSDFLDHCPNTSLNVRAMVDKHGCPMDSDLDGISDYQDNCPTLAGVASNMGCPEIKQEVKALFKQALQGIQFETNKADIKPFSSAILNKIVTILQQNPDYLIEIQGHTDNIGKSSENMQLSLNRAHAVLSYFSNKGLNADRFTARGFGDTQPLETNKTPSGRAVNRRVEFVVSFAK